LHSSHYGQCFWLLPFSLTTPYTPAIRQTMTEPITPPSEPVAPTDEEIMELMPQQMRDDLANAARALAGFDRATVKAAGAMRIILNRHAVDHARVVLAKWSHQ